MKPREKVVPKWHKKPYEWNQVSEKPEAGQAARPQEGLRVQQAGERRRRRGGQRCQSRGGAAGRLPLRRAQLGRSFTSDSAAP